MVIGLNPAAPVVFYAAFGKAEAFRGGTAPNGFTKTISADGGCSLKGAFCSAKGRAANVPSAWPSSTRTSFSVAARCIFILRLRFSLDSRN